MISYARLTGRLGGEGSQECQFFITDLPVYLGRVPLSDNSDGASIVINGKDTLLSRQHVKIQWDPNNGWQLLVLSKNGCTVDKTKYTKDDTVNLHDGSAIRIGHSHLYFTLPIVTETSSKSGDNVQRKRPKEAGSDDDHPDSVAKKRTSVSKRLTTPPYFEMVLAAIESKELTLYENNSVSQQEVGTWIIDNFDFGDLQRQSIRKGVYNVFERNTNLFEKVEKETEASKLKKDLVLWRRKEGSILP